MSAAQMEICMPLNSAALADKKPAGRRLSTVKDASNTFLNPERAFGASYSMKMKRPASISCSVSRSFSL